MATEHKTYELVVELRQPEKQASRKLAKEGLVPGVVYGHNVPAESVQMTKRELDRVYLRSGGNSLVDLRVGGTSARKVFIHNVQRDPQTHNIRHVDFLVVNLREEITSAVPLVIVGESPIVVANEGLLLTLLDHVQVRALPMDLPSIIEVDVSGLDEIGKTIHITDLTIPGNVTLLTDSEEPVAKVVDLPVAEVVEEPEVAEAEEGADAEGSDTEGAADGESSDSSES